MTATAPPLGTPPALPASAEPPAPTTPVPQGVPLWGLALSGGGIRSATFCLGVLVALARHGSLLRFHLLSTVSGGGFIGALVGKLFHRATSAADVQAALAQADRRWFTWWLRAHGDYLFARGTRDAFAAAAVMLRNLLALHIELALLALLAAALLALLNLGVWSVVDRLWVPAPEAVNLLQRTLRRLPGWLPTLWLALPPLLLAAGTVLCAYWALPRRLDRDGGIRLALVVVTAVVALAGLGAFWPDLVGAKALGLPRSLVVAAAVMALMWIAGSLLAALLLRGQEAAASDALSGARAPQPPAGNAAGHIEDRIRNRMTRWLGSLLQATLLVVAIGALERAAWWVAFEATAWLAAGPGMLVIAAALRTLLPVLGGSSGKAPPWLGGGLLGIAHGLGLLLTVGLTVWWMALAYTQIFDTVFRPGLTEPAFIKGAAVALLFGLGAGAFLFFTGQDAEFANLSSLHRFYKARLLRGWLGAANPGRLPGGLATPGREIEQRSEEPVEGYSLGSEVGHVHERDDVPWRDYQPRRDGSGPQHLVNVCLNHTVRGSGPFNADRKGQMLTVAPGGWLRLGARPWTAMDAQTDAMTLGTWTAISGAAFSPGLGSMTRSGIAALAMFAGVRLGYWWDRSHLKGARGLTQFVKSSLLVNELFGRFRGDQGRHWFLSDGGHFENTGAYALLRERARLIVLADCGADPDYRFGDLENLVRKARVDFGAAIRFLKPDLTYAGPEWRRFGSVSDLASPASDACMALAEVTYADDGSGDPERNRGWLVLLKPNMFSGLPVDLINFRNANPAFPQQATSDQRFDEAQWESYFMLGRAITAQLDDPLLQRIAAGEADGRFKRDDGRQLGLAAPGKPAGLRERLASGTAGAALSLGTAATLGVTVWQSIDAWRSSSAKAAEADDKALKELTEGWGRLRPVVLPAVGASTGASAAAGPSAAPVAPVTAGAASPTLPPALTAELTARAANAGALAASLMRIGDTLCPNGFDRWFRPQPGERGESARQPIGARVLRDAQAACRELESGAPQQTPPSCSQLLAIADERHCLYQDNGAPWADKGSFLHCPPRYWVRQYALGAVVGNCWPERKAAPLALPPTPAPPVVAPAPNAVVPPALPPGPPPALVPAPTPIPAPGPLAACKNTRVYLQVYGKARAADAVALRQDLIAAGAQVPRTEDMNARAELGKRSAPEPVRLDTVRWHIAAQSTCAAELGAWLESQGELKRPARVEPLAARYVPQPGVLEVWLAPRAALASR